MSDAKITIIEVAKAAGVSPSTVSHAISGKRKISHEVKHRIFACMKELNYRPNFFARGLKNNTTMLIGIALTDCANYISALQVQEFSMLLLKFGYDVVLGISGNNEKRGREVLTRFSSGMTDGIINLLPYIDVNEAALLCGNVPVYTNLRDDYAPLHIDFEQAAWEILQYLWDNGHRDIAFIASPTRAFIGGDPLVGVYKSFMKKQRKPLLPGSIAVGENTSASGYACTAQLLKEQNFTAIFAGNDQMALGVYQYAAESRIAIPEELSIVGMDDSPLAALCTPPLTTAAYPLETMCAHAVKAILRKINHEAPLPQMKLDLPLIKRGSVSIRK